NGENIHELGIEPDIAVEEVKLSDEQIPAFEQLMTDNIISTYVKDNPEPSEENIRRFASLNKDKGIDENILTLLVRNEYLSKMPYDKRPIADPLFDTTLNRAVQFIRTGR
ncbi:MAG: carboxyl-terminal protease, partial [Spirochaetales bacterium]|nr:carboxyl-terminal protease [Spirochaetales bacterium]